MTETTGRVTAGTAAASMAMPVRGDGTGDTAAAVVGHPAHDPAPVSRARTVGRFLAHLAEMVVVMVLGMLALAPAWDLAGAALGVQAALARPDVGVQHPVADGEAQHARHGARQPPPDVAAEAHESAAAVVRDGPPGAHDAILPAPTPLRGVPRRLDDICHTGS